MSFHLSAPESLHLRPTVEERICPRCKGWTLGEILCCKGTNVLANWGRYYQKCGNPMCIQAGGGRPAFVWHNPETPVASIPEEVQLAFARKVSAQETPPGLSQAGQLHCQQPNCTTASGRPRSANAQCSRDPPSCRQCCQRLGGCLLNTHKVSGGREQFPGLSIQDLQPTPMAPNPTQSVTYARAMHADYAQAYAEAHRLYEKRTAALKDSEQGFKDIANAIEVVVWTEKNAPSQVLTILAAEHKGIRTITLCQAEHFMYMLKDPRAVFVLHIPANVSRRSEWRLHPVSLAIDTSCCSRIFVRQQHLAEQDCVGLDLEISAYKEIMGLGQGLPASAIREAQRLPQHLPLKTAVHYKKTQANEASNSSKFPLRYVCDMAPALSKLRGLTEVARQRRFAVLFPDARYVRSTVMNALTIYKKGQDLNLVDQYILYERRPEGAWNKFTKAVKQGHCVSPQSTQTHSSPSKSDVIELMSSSEDSDSEAGKNKADAYAVVEGVEVFTEVNNVFSSEWEAGSQQTAGLYVSNVIPPRTPFSKPVDMISMKFRSGDNLRNFAVKRSPESPLPTPVPVPNKEYGEWIEAFRLAQCADYFKMFRHLASRSDFEVAIANVEVIDTFFINLFGAPSAALQHWTDGKIFKSKSYIRHLSLDVQTLEAFSHFSYSWSHKKTVMVDFEGHQDTDGAIKIFDCTTHSLTTNHGFGQYYRGNAQAQGIMAFKQGHSCNAICRAMHLDPLA